MIVVNELVKTYPGNVRALDGVSFHIEPGEICGYLGANGAGKSTTIKILTGMMSADSGSAVINGINVFENPNKVKKIIGYVPESGEMFLSLTPFDFLEFVCKIYDIEKAIYVKRIYDFMELFDLKNEVNTPLASFSKGMRQKVLIISSIIHNPAVIFWDEPLSGLDFNSISLIKDLIKDLSANGKTFFYSTHILDIIQKVCTKVIILNSGKVVLDKPVSEIGSTSSLENIFRQYIDTASIKEKAEGIYKNLSNP